MTPSERASALSRLFAVRSRYRAIESRMRAEVVSLQGALHDKTAALMDRLSEGEEPTADLRAECEDVVDAVASAERGLVDVQGAIDTVGREIALQLARCLRA